MCKLVVLILYSSVFMSSWQWQFTAKTCGAIHVYGWVVILCKLCAIVVLYVCESQLQQTEWIRVN
jgi:hypothetical protein